jgi:hypothetical protein
LPFIDYLFRVYVIFWLLYFDLLQVKVQLVSKRMMNYIVTCLWIVGFNMGMKLDLVVMICRCTGKGWSLAMSPSLGTVL